MSNMKGMLSFLETKPEDYARLFAREAASPAPTQPEESTPLSSSIPDSSLHPESKLPPSSNLQPDGDLLSDSNLVSDSNLDPGGYLPPDSNLAADSNLLPASDLPRATSTASPLPGGKLLPGSDLLTQNGRTVRIREARSVQDGHTSGEHLLLQTMWKKGSPETEDTRLLKAGLAELSRWTGAHKTSCRAYLRALISKLALEEAETFNAAAGKEGARVYRIFSFNAILERRRRAGMTHVIRTGAVWFVDPRNGTRLLPGSNLQSDRNLLVDSNLPLASGSNQAALPGSRLAPINNNKAEEPATTTTAPIVQAMHETLGYSDDAAARQITTACRERAPDATGDEIAYFIRLHGSRIRKIRGIDNPMGLLIRQVPRCFEGETLRQMREEGARRREAERRQWRQILDDPHSSAEDREWARRILGEELQS